MLQIVICDDEMSEALRTEAILKTFLEKKKENYEIQIENNGKELLEKSKENTWVPNVIFMDIEVGEDSGIDLVKKINEYIPSCIIIYLSNYITYALDVYSTEHQYYVLKNQLEERLDEVYEKIKQLEDKRGKRIPITLKYNQVVNLRQDKICCFERKGRKTLIVTENGTYETYQGLEELQALLLDDFVRCHNSYIVNMQKAISYRRESFTVLPGLKIPISRFYQPKVKESYMNWSKENLFL